MFIFRTVFWLSLVVLVLPTDAEQQARLYANVSHAAHQTATFCDRHQDVCARGAEYWATFRTKLEFGARMAMDIASERLNGQSPVKPASATKPVRGTLTPEDLAPQWRGRLPRQGA